MKKRLFIGIVPLVLLVIGVLFAMRYHTPKEENSMNAIIDTPKEENSMDAILATLSPEDQESYKKDYEQTMQRIKSSGDAEWVAYFEKIYLEAVQESINSDDLPDDDHQSVAYYENEIRKAKKEGASEEHIASLEGLRDFHINSIRRQEELEREYEEIDRKRQADLARYKALSTPEEKTAYHKEKLQEAEGELLEAQEELRLAKEKGDPADIEWAELLVKGAESRIDTRKRQLAWVPVQERVDATIQRTDAAIQRWKEVEIPQFIAKYRSYLQVEVVDGVEQIVGVRSHEEIKQILNNRMIPAGDVDTVPSVPTTPSETHPDTSSGSHLLESQPPSDEMVSPIGATPDRSMDSIIKAQTQFRSWRDGIDQDYVDVLISRYMSAEELETHFPTAEARANLTRRTSEMEKLVVSQVRDLIKEIPDAKQKREITHKLLRDNFDKNFADNVLKALENNAE